MTMRTRITAVAAGLLTVATPLVTGLPAAHAASPVYTITGVTHSFTLGLQENPAACSWAGANDITLSVTSEVKDPVTTGQVSVKGLRLKVLHNGDSLGTIAVRSAELEPGHDKHGSFLTLSCKDWKPLMTHGFGGPGSAYHVKVIGPGTARDQDQGDPAGTVTAPPTKFAVTVPQLAKIASPTARKSGTDVVVSTAFDRWAADSKGDYAWRPLAKHRVLLQRSGSTSWSKVAGTTTTSTGRANLRFTPKKDNYVRFHLAHAAYTYGWQVVYYADAKGNISLAGR